MKEALSQADFVQENGPERPGFQDEAVRRHGRRHSGRFAHRVELVGHHAERHAVEVQASRACAWSDIRSIRRTSFRSVEVVGGAKTSPDAIQQAMAFYASIGKKPIHLRKELPGHVANRLQAALYREVLYLIEQGVLSVDDADDAVSYGPGTSLGRHGAEPAVAPRRRRRRNQAFHGAPDGPAGRA